MTPQEQSMHMVKCMYDNKFEKVFEALKAGWNPDIAATNGQLPIYVAAAATQENLCLKMIEKGASVHRLHDSQQDSLLHYAISHNMLELYDLLIKTPGYDIDVMNIFGETPLATAAEKGKESMCRTLLAMDADINAGNNDHFPLHYAAYAGKEDICRFLLDHGAHTKRFGYHQLRKFKDNPPLAKLLRHHGAWEQENCAEMLEPIRKEMEDAVKATFSTETPAAPDAYLKNNKPTDSLLDACASGLFADYIAIPLMTRGDKEDRQLLSDIFVAIPECWREQNASLMATLASMDSSPSSYAERGKARD